MDRHSKSSKDRMKKLLELKDVQIKTKTIEQSMLPLIQQVSMLQEVVPGEYRKKRRMRNVHNLIQIVTKATDNFINVAEQVAAENPDFQEELWLSCEEVRNSGHSLERASLEYASDTLHTRKRGAMHDGAKELLLAVTRLLVIIDLVDINELLKASSRVEAKLQRLRNIKTWDGFVESIKSVTKELQNVSQLARARQEELKSSAAQQLLVAAQAELKQSNKMLITSTKIFLEHPNDENAQENREYAIKRMQEAVKTIALIADGADPLTVQQEQNQDSEEEEEEEEDDEFAFASPIPPLPLFSLVHSVPPPSTLSHTVIQPPPPPPPPKPKQPPISSHYTTQSYPPTHRASSPPSSPDSSSSLSRSHRLPANASPPLVAAGLIPRSPPSTHTSPPLPAHISPQAIPPLQLPATDSTQQSPGLPRHQQPPRMPKELAKRFQTFETMLEVSVGSPPPVETPRNLQAGFDLIMAAAAKLAASESTRDTHGLLAQCDVVREKLQDFISVIKTEPVKDEQNESRNEEINENNNPPSPLPTAPSPETVRQSKVVVEEETATLRGELRRAMIDHVSDTFVDPFVPLNRMVEGAFKGEVQTVEECSVQFTAHAEKLAHVANLVCSLTSDNTGTQSVRKAAKQISLLKQQVACAAKTLAAHPSSEAAQKNLTTFKEAWIDHITVLTDSLDAIIPIQDFIAVTEAHVREDSCHLIEALEHGDVAMATSFTKVIQGRCQRMVQVVHSDIGNNPTRYSHEHVQQIEELTTKLQEKTLVKLQTKTNKTCEKKNTRHFDSQLRELEDQLQTVNDSIRDIRKCVLTTRTKAELQGEPDIDDIISPIYTTSSNSLENMFEFLTFSDGGSPVSPMLTRRNPIGIEIEEVEMSLSDLKSLQLENILEEEEEEEEMTTNVKEKKTAKEKEKEEKKERGESPKRIDTPVTNTSPSPVSPSFSTSASSSAHGDYSSTAHDSSTAHGDYYVTNTIRRRLIKRTPSVAVLNESETAQAMMKQLPAHERAKIAKAQEKLNVEKQKLESEVNRWDDSGNDIVLLAKEMCWMMMDMSDFTRGLGPLKTTVDVSNTAKDIARAGQYLDKLVKKVVDACPDESVCTDLRAYLERIQLYCHQLKITSSVSEDLGKSVKETVETANNLIINAKNLMNTVVQVVKTCYVASVSIERKQGSKPTQFMQWQLMTPEKKLLYQESVTNEGGMVKGPQRTSMSVIKELGNFRGRTSSKPIAPEDL